MLHTHYRRVRFHPHVECGKTYRCSTIQRRSDSARNGVVVAGRFRGRNGWVSIRGEGVSVGDRKSGRGGRGCMCVGSGEVRSVRGHTTLFGLLPRTRDQYRWCRNWVVLLAREALVGGCV
ncbi:hypothetical protein BDR03DRAFT_947465 [Suillus americanus]|nr:hypothetical protein BDR03DRAFT_947465 [Suillus americanus]